MDRTQKNTDAAVYIPGQTIGHHGGSVGLYAWCNQDAPDSDTITCWLGYPECNVRVWLPGTLFDLGQVATNANKFWFSKENANTGNTPAEDTHWTEVTAYNEATTYNITTGPIWCLYDNKLWRSLQAGNVGHIPTEGAWWTTKAPAWLIGTNYVIGGRATHAGKRWRSLTGTIAAPNVGNEPAAGAFWKEIPEIEVHCNIAGGNSLLFAFPLLAEQQRIRVEYNTENARYEAIALFQAAEETCAEASMLELVNEMVVTEFSNSSGGTDPTWADAAYAGRGLRFAAQANSTYIIEYAILYTAAATTTGIKLQLTGPASPISIDAVFYGQNTLAPLAINAYEIPVTFSESLVGVNFIRGDCVFKNGAIAGEVTLQFASEVNSSLVTVKIGSNIKYRRISRIE